MPASLLLDPWPPDYESAVQVDVDEDDLASAQVHTDVETAQWVPIQQGCTAPFTSTAFIDGVRRIEARVIAHEPGKLIYGLFGAIGVGNVFRNDHNARIASAFVQRYLILGSGKKKTEAIPVGGSNLAFDGFASGYNTPPDMVRELQNLMRIAEASLGQSLLSPSTCIFVDGPLTYYSTSSQALVGVIKRIHRLYLPTEYLDLLARLESGQRTPLFLIDDGKYNRYSCYVRLTNPLPTEHPYAGLIRIEIRAAVGLETTLNLANFTSQELPKFASSRIRDPRAPQNLLPIGALEDELKRRLGDALLIQRGIQQRIFEGVQV
jgi:uncharacterized protein